MDNVNNLFIQKTGNDFEDEVAEVLHYYAKSNGTEKFFVNCTGTKTDKFAGTDLFVDGIPVDVTCAYSTKNHMIKLAESIDANGTTVNFGIRTGNGKVTFKTPVIVIGIDAEPFFLNSYMEKIVSDMKAKISDIMDIVNDKFYEYCDNMGINPEMEVV